jgi:hypothetical protein
MQHFWDAEINALKQNFLPGSRLWRWTWQTDSNWVSSIISQRNSKQIGIRLVLGNFSSKVLKNTLKLYHHIPKKYILMEYFRVWIGNLDVE